jgi:hypothetical protein
VEESSSALSSQDDTSSFTSSEQPIRGSADNGAYHDRNLASEQSIRVDRTITGSITVGEELMGESARVGGDAVYLVQGPTCCGTHKDVSRSEKSVHCEGAGGPDCRAIFWAVIIWHQMSSSAVWCNTQVTYNPAAFCKDEKYNMYLIIYIGNDCNLGIFLFELYKKDCVQP